MTTQTPAHILAVIMAQNPHHAEAIAKTGMQMANSGLKTNGISVDPTGYGVMPIDANLPGTSSKQPAAGGPAVGGGVKATKAPTQPTMSVGTVTN